MSDLGSDFKRSTFGSWHCMPCGLTFKTRRNAEGHLTNGGHITRSARAKYHGRGWHTLTEIDVILEAHALIERGPIAYIPGGPAARPEDPRGVRYGVWVPCWVPTASAESAGKATVKTIIDFIVKHPADLPIYTELQSLWRLGASASQRFNVWLPELTKFEQERSQ